MTSTIEAQDNITTGLRRQDPVFWVNPDRSTDGSAGRNWGEGHIDAAVMLDAASRFARFRGVLQTLFPELRKTNGVIESELLAVNGIQSALGITAKSGSLYVKADHSLPIAGSIKARGGIHEVLQFAERIALEKGLITDTNPANILSSEGKEFLSRHSIAVGSTGNLGLSIGVIASALGFDTTVHMSSDAKEWKKKRLRDRGVHVVEHTGDYAAAVAAGRTEAQKDPLCHFVDDESSLSLFAGYSAAALTLQSQLAERCIEVSDQHPLFVYIPCGVGGAPGGIAFGLSQVFGPNVHCFFAEPTASPCFLVAMMDRSGGHPSVYDIGLDNRTEADGLAVPQASECAVSVMRPALAGVFTVNDDTLFEHLHTAATREQLRIEPSAAAAFDGPSWLIDSQQGKDYLAKHDLNGCMHNATHIIWTTGGLFVPDAEYEKFFKRGAALSSQVVPSQP